MSVTSTLMICVRGSDGQRQGNEVVRMGGWSSATARAGGGPAAQAREDPAGARAPPGGPPPGPPAPPGTQRCSCSSAAPPSRCARCPPWLRGRGGRVGGWRPTEEVDHWWVQVPACSERAAAGHRSPAASPAATGLSAATHPHPPVNTSSRGMRGTVARTWRAGGRQAGAGSGSCHHESPTRPATAVARRSRIPSGKGGI